VGPKGPLENRNPKKELYIFGELTPLISFAATKRWFFGFKIGVALKGQGMA
jgi:hypothetical protein